VALHTYHKQFATRWVTIHDTATDGMTPFNANTLAKQDHGTPFKRPENGQFRPGTGFREFYFDETGDTDATSPENPLGGWTGVFKLSQRDPGADAGTLSLFYTGDQAHAGFDNVTFLSADKVTFVEDAGDTLHSQRNALDSGFVLDVNADYANPANQPVRWLAEGRDASATIDSANGGFGSNDGDNEVTGVHVSDGDPGPEGLLGAQVPKLGHDGWRWFYTQQHGDNPTYEVLLRRSFTNW
jgi:secreted PhoX family phosphatase